LAAITFVAVTVAASVHLYRQVELTPLQERLEQITLGQHVARLDEALRQHKKVIEAHESALKALASRADQCTRALQDVELKLTAVLPAEEPPTQ
jgi:urocanate hydratase